MVAVKGVRRRITAKLLGYCRVVLTVILSLCMAFGSFPVEAMAASGTDPKKVTYNSLYEHELDGQPAYCLDPDWPGPPVGTAVSEWKSGSLALDYLLYHSPGGSKNSDDIWYPQKEIRCAVYAVLNGEWYISHYPSGDAMDDWVYNIVKPAYDAAMAYQKAGGGGDEEGCSRIYYCGPDYQRLAIAVPVDHTHSVRLAVVKTSANKPITDGNSCYSLEGAEYTVYSDSGCTKKVSTITTNASGKGNVTVKFTGDSTTYWVKETKAPKGYALDPNVYKTTVKADDEVVYVNGSAGVKDKPMNDPILIKVGKVDKATTQNMPQGSASLEGAQFTVRYYDNVAGNTSGNATRTWVIATTSDGIAMLADKYLVGGDELYKNSSGHTLVPLGTVTVQETKAPEGYYLEGQDTANKQADANYTAPVHKYIIDSNNADVEAVNVYVEPNAPEPVIRGGVKVGKVDAENGTAYTQGAASFTGATFSIVNNSEGQVVVNGNAFGKGDVVATLTIPEGQNTVESAADLLPYGDYTIYESARPEGYLENSDWSRSFSVRSSGIVDLTGHDDLVSEQVIRGDLQGVKYLESNEQPLAGIPFVITSATTGESHVIVTGEDGAFSTASSATAHSANTNANDGYVVPDGAGYKVVEDFEIVPDAGIWFVGNEAAPASVNDDLGALPYDTYYVQEVPCAANHGLDLVSLTVNVRHENVTEDLGEVIDYMSNVDLEIGTALTGDGDKLVPAEVVELIDRVDYETIDITLGDYIMSGELHVVNEDGTDGGVVGEGATTFSPTERDGYVDVSFTIDAAQLAGRRVVAFEKLISEGEVIKTHEDLDDEGQSVYVPSVETQARDEERGDKFSLATGDDIIIDTVDYHNLIVGREYTIEGYLHIHDRQGNDLGIAKNSAGEDAYASTTFVAEQTDGTVELEFHVDSRPAAGYDLVAFEELKHEGYTYAAHADITDDAQSVRVPWIGTELMTEDGTHDTPGYHELTLVDQVEYWNLTPGVEYVMSGEIHLRGTDGSDEGVLTDAAGNNVVAEAKFVPETENGYTSLTFTLDASLLQGRALVAFESVADSVGVIAEHKDITDTDQTVYIQVPNIGTTATYAGTGEKEVPAVNDAVVIDTVAYYGLTPGDEYVMTGSVMTVVEGEGGPQAGEQVKVAALDSDDWGKTVQVTFVPESAEGTIDMPITVHAKDLEGSKLVVFETATRGKETVATHADPSDEGQTVFVPRIGTTLTGVDEAKSVGSDSTVTLTDVVAYENLTPGEEYVLRGMLHVKETKDGKVVDGGVLKDDNNKKQTAEGESSLVTATATFVPEESNGTANVTFTFDATGRGTLDVVAFESLWHGETLVAEHAEIEDKGQTVALVAPSIGTKLANAADGKQSVLSNGKVTLTDTVEYKNLAVGEEYTLSGELHVATGKGKNAKDGGILQARVSATTASGSTVRSNKKVTTITAEATPEVMGSSLYETMTQRINQVGYKQFFWTGKDTTYHLNEQCSHLGSVEAYYAGDAVAAISEGATNACPDCAVLGASQTIAKKNPSTVTAAAQKSNVVATTTFKPTSPDGTVKISFTFDASDLGDCRVVAFETVTRKGITIAEHKDITDANQTVTFRSLNDMPQTGFGAQAGVLAVVSLATATVAGALWLVRKKLVRS